MTVDPPVAGLGALADAIAAIRAMTWRADVTVREIPAPGGLAPESFALSGDVRQDDDSADSPFGTGRFVLLSDPDEPSPWNGPLRVVCFAQAPLEPEIGNDPFLEAVAWSWLVDALESRGAQYHSASGTATKTLSRGFGSLAAQGEGAQIELRASWSPAPDDLGSLTAHVEAWVELLCMLAGLPPGSEGISTLTARRTPRG